MVDYLFDCIHRVLRRVLSDGIALDMVFFSVDIYVFTLFIFSFGYFIDSVVFDHFRSRISSRHIKHRQGELR